MLSAWALSVAPLPYPDWPGIYAAPHIHCVKTTMRTSPWGDVRIAAYAATP